MCLPPHFPVFSPLLAIVQVEVSYVRCWVSWKTSCQDNRVAGCWRVVVGLEDMEGPFQSETFWLQN